VRRSLLFRATLDREVLVAAVEMVLSDFFLDDTGFAIIEKLMGIPRDFSFFSLVGSLVGQLFGLGFDFGAQSFSALPFCARMNASWLFFDSAIARLSY
jgi:hypothetical protein